MAAQKVHHIPARHNLSSFKSLANVGEKKRLPGSASARNSTATACTGRLHRSRYIGHDHVSGACTYFAVENGNEIGLQITAGAPGHAHTRRVLDAPAYRPAAPRYSDLAARHYNSAGPGCLELGHAGSYRIAVDRRRRDQKPRKEKSRKQCS
jgi:hypothetical protein